MQNFTFTQFSMNEFLVQTNKIMLGMLIGMFKKREETICDNTLIQYQRGRK